MGALVYDSTLGAWKDAGLSAFSGGAKQDCAGRAWYSVNQAWVDVVSINGKILENDKLYYSYEYGSNKEYERTSDGIIYRRNNGMDNRVSFHVGDISKYSYICMESSSISNYSNHYLYIQYAKYPDYFARNYNYEVHGTNGCFSHEIIKCPILNDDVATDALISFLIYYSGSSTSWPIEFKIHKIWLE